VQHYAGLSPIRRRSPRVGTVVSHQIDRDVFTWRVLANDGRLPITKTCCSRAQPARRGLATDVFGAFEKHSDPARPSEINSTWAFSSAWKIHFVGRRLFLEGTPIRLRLRPAYSARPLPFRFPGGNPSSNGVSFRISTTNIHGFKPTPTWATTRRATSARKWGLVFNSPSTRVFRIDHDRRSSRPPICVIRAEQWPVGAFTSGAYDSGLVAGAVTSLDDALALSADQAAQIGFFCGSQVANAGARRSPAAVLRTSARSGLNIPAPGHRG